MKTYSRTQKIDSSSASVSPLIGLFWNNAQLPIDAAVQSAGEDREKFFKEETFPSQLFLHRLKLYFFLRVQYKLP